jgi:hypothetical protein
VMPFTGEFSWVKKAFYRKAAKRRQTPRKDDA